MRSFSIGSKLLLLLLLAGVLGAAVAGLVADYYGGAALKEAVTQQMTFARENKREEIVDYFARLKNEAQLLSETPTTLKAFKSFSEAFQQMGKDGPKEPASVESAPPELLKFYREDFLPKLARESEGVPTLEAYLPASAAARRLQTDYLASNTGPERWKLDAGAGGTAYDRAHAEFHPFLVEARRRMRIDDIMMVDLQGNVIYELAKQTDFATNLRDGPYARTGEARAFENALNLRDGGSVAFEPFSPYPPDYLAATSFFSTPVIEHGATIGAILIQISTDEIEREVTSDHNWSNVGLGKTGSIYIVGPDGKARSNDRFLLEDKPGFLKALAAAGVEKSVIDRIDRTGSIILTLPIDTEATRAALRGESGVGLIRDYRNLPVLSAWAPLGLPGVHWAVIAEMDAAEAFAPQNAFRKALLLAIALTTIALTLLSFLGSEAFVRPIRTIMAGVKALSAGNDRARIPVNGDDEFAKLAEGFNAMADEIEARNAHILEKTEEYEQLLKNIYPEIVAERVKMGQTTISELIQNVSVVVITIDGVSALLHSKELDTVASVNVIIDAFDAAALRHGVEKIRTLGERYYAACGLSTPRLDHAARAVAFAEDCCRTLAQLGKTLGISLRLRAGIASGDVEAGLIGRQRTVYDLWGFTTMTADRILFEAAANSIRVTEATFEALGRPARFSPRPTIQTASLGAIETFEFSALPDEPDAKAAVKAEMANG
jgi:class 3 adenylate cyclase